MAPIPCKPYTQLADQAGPKMLNSGTLRSYADRSSRCCRSVLCRSYPPARKDKALGLEHKNLELQMNAPDKRKVL